MTGSRNRWKGGTLVLATITTGLVAGVFFDWSQTIMPGLATTDDRTFVAVFRALDAAILGSLFMPAFMGALVVIGIAAALHLRQDPWVPVAFVLYLAALVITMAVHEPINTIVRTAAEGADAATLRAMVEGGWVGWHHVRTVATTAAFGCLTWALVRHGRATAPVPGPASTAPYGPRS